MKTLAWTIGLGMLTITLIPGCGGGSGDGGSVSSGVDPTKRGDDLTDDEARQICEAGSDYIERRMSKIDPCNFAGVLAAQLMATLDPSATDAQIQEVCTEGIRACEQTDNEDPITAPEADSCDDLNVPDECSATVGEIERCIQDTVDVSLSVFTDLPACGSLTRDFLENYTGPDTQTPASCVALDEKCPGVVETVEGVPLDD